MRERSSKVKLGRAAIVGAIALMMAVVPIRAEDVNAAMPSYAGDGGTNEHAVPVNNKSYIPASVELTLDPKNDYTANVKTDAQTEKGSRIDVRATVKVENSGGYTVMLSTDSTELTSGENKIVSTTQPTTLDQMAAGTWGYYGNISESGYYKPIELSKTLIAKTMGTENINEAQDINIGFAAKFSAEQAPGNYTNTFTISVVSQPGR